ncbi:hypothetical protein EV702DRAFT_1196538 [Suillus placidus]|uniref:Uncharacterized protein n=1 Tax=Suillus placidus TaxID=48579 RepID=A0A9P6ZWJ1_9AGAM|nr:hypothetical protein EV702DRAFT_1196538 [Suillus placidus]
MSLVSQAYTGTMRGGAAIGGDAAWAVWNSFLQLRQSCGTMRQYHNTGWLFYLQVQAILPNSHGTQGHHTFHPALATSAPLVDNPPDTKQDENPPLTVQDSNPSTIVSSSTTDLASGKLSIILPITSSTLISTPSAKKTRSAHVTSTSSHVTSSGNSPMTSTVHASKLTPATAVSGAQGAAPPPVSTPIPPPVTLEIRDLSALECIMHMVQMKDAVLLKVM